MLTSMEITEIVTQEIRNLLTEDGRGDVEITGASLLSHDLALDSLMLASLLITLEDRFGKDPFLEDLSITEISSVDDLVRAYQTVVADLAVA